MKKTLFIAALLACGLTVLAQGSLSIGNYDEIEEGESPTTSNLYEGSYWEVAPINFYLTNSGTQVIYTQEQVADLAGKDITGIKLKYYSEGAYIAGDAHLTIYLTETNRSEFWKDSTTKRYRCFDVSRTSAVFDSDINVDTYDYDYLCGEVVIPFDNTFHYSGNNNLVLTISASGVSDCTSGGFYVNFFYAEGMEDQALVWANDSKSWDEVLSGNDGENLYLPSFGVSVISAPVLQIDYTTGTEPEAIWFSYVPTQDEDLDLVGFDAYKVTAFSTDAVSTERVAKAKKGEPLVVRSSIVPSISPATGVTKAADNLLQVSDGTVLSDGTLYCLANKSEGYGFYRIEPGVRVPENKVYLQADAEANEFMSFSGEASGIGTTYMDRRQDDNYYNLQGQRVSHPTKGVYIHHGQKEVVK